MNPPTSNIPRSQSVLRRFLISYRNPAWMRARIAFNIFRVLLGVVLLASIPWLGPLAWLGTIPLAWAALSFWADHRVKRSVRGGPGRRA
jgi:hypothetical protein